MTKQLHKRFIDEQIKSLLQRYNDREIKLEYILDILALEGDDFFNYSKDIGTILKSFLSRTKEKSRQERKAKN